MHLRYAMAVALAALSCAEPKEAADNKTGSATGSGEVGSTGQAEPGGKGSGATSDGTTAGTTAGGTVGASTAGGAASSSMTNQATGGIALAVTLGQTSLPTIDSGSFGFSSHFLYSFDSCGWATSHKDTTMPSLGAAVMLVLPSVDTTGTTQVMPPSGDDAKSGPLSLRETRPYAVVAKGCDRTVYRARSGTITFSSRTGLASSTKVSGTVDLVLEGGSPAVSLTVKGPFALSAAQCDPGKNSAASATACTLPAATHAIGALVGDY